MELVKLIEHPGRSSNFRVDAFAPAGINANDFRRKVFTGHEFVLDPGCRAAKGPKQAMSSNLGFVGMFAGIFAAIAVGFMVVPLSAFWGWAASMLTVMSLWTAGAFIGARIDHGLARLHWTKDGDFAYYVKDTGLGAKWQELWNRAIKVARMTDALGTTEALGIDDLLLKIHACLLAIDADDGYSRNRSALVNHVRAMVVHLERTAQADAMRRSGVPVAEIAPVPTEPQLVEWTADGKPLAERELDHAEELR